MGSTQVSYLRGAGARAAGTVVATMAAITRHGRSTLASGGGDSGWMCSGGNGGSVRAGVGPANKDFEMKMKRGFR